MVSLTWDAVFENFTTLMGWYGYGRSLLNMFSVSASLPVQEYLVVYAGVKLADAMQIQTWCNRSLST